MLVILFCSLVCVYMYIRYVRSSLAVVSCGGGHEGKYSSDIHLYTCKCLHFKLNSGKRFEYPKFQIQIKFHPVLIMRAVHACVCICMHISSVS